MRPAGQRQSRGNLPPIYQTHSAERGAVSYARELADRYQVAADVCIHAPNKRGDDRNHHAHILLSACRTAPDGTLGKKSAELDPIHCRHQKINNAADVERWRWEVMANSALKEAGQGARIDHRSLKAQGIDRKPTRHLGVSAVGYERRTSQKSRRRETQEAEATAREEAVKEIATLQIEEKAIDELIRAETAPAAQNQKQSESDAWLARLSPDTRALIDDFKAPPKSHKRPLRGSQKLQQPTQKMLTRLCQP